MCQIRAWLIVFGRIITSTGIPLSELCPLELSPSDVVVKFGESAVVNCSTYTTDVIGMGWEAPIGTSSKRNAKFVTWSVESVEEWSITPKCYITKEDYEQCTKKLPVTVYKMPDSVSISQLNVTGPMMEGRVYELRCDVSNIAPVRNLSVIWYKGNEIICNETHDKPIATPQNESYSLIITPHKDDNGTQVLCKAKFNLGFSGPDPSSIISSEPYDVIVHYPPVLLSPQPETLDVAGNDKPILNCSAIGNPTPVYRWESSPPIQLEMGNEAVFIPSSSLLPGTYNCTVSNGLGSTVTKHFVITQTPSSRSGTTAGIVVAMLILVGVIMAFVVYHKNSSSVAKCEESGQKS